MEIKSTSLNSHTGVKSGGSSGGLFASDQRALQSALGQVKSENPAFLRLLEGDQACKESFDYAQNLKSKFDHLMVVGIGGSHLGAESFVKALKYPSQVTFLENLDPEGVSRSFAQIQSIKKTHFVFVSKSGSTYETLGLSNWVLDQLQLEGLDPQNHCTVITSGQSPNPLRAWALDNEVKCLDLPKDLSGRYSVLSPVGFLPIYFALDLTLEGSLAPARAASENEEAVLKWAANLFGAFKSGATVINLWTYSDSMQGFAKWWRQLYSESLGHQLKGEMTQVPVCVLCQGATDQHSYLQQAIDQSQGHFNIIVSLKGFGSELENLKVGKDHFQSHWNLGNTALAHLFQRESMGLVKTFQDLKIPYMHIELKDLSFASLSYYVMQQQLVIATLGKALNINPYTQPAVEQMKLRIKQLSDINPRK